MYRITFYPELREKRLATRRRTLRDGALAAICLVQLIALVMLVVSGLAFGKRASLTRDSIERLSTQLRTGTPPVEVAVARELVQIRESRIDWSTKLVALSKEIQPSLLVTRLEGRAAASRTPGRLLVEGEVQNGSEPLESVSLLLERLRREKAVVKDFPQVELGTLKGRAGSEFELVCRTADGGS